MVKKLLTTPPSKLSIRDQVLQIMLIWFVGGAICLGIFMPWMGEYVVIPIVLLVLYIGHRYLSIRCKA